MPPKRVANDKWLLLYDESTYQKVLERWQAGLPLAFDISTSNAGNLIFNSQIPGRRTELAEGKDMAILLGPRNDKASLAGLEARYNLIERGTYYRLFQDLGAVLPRKQVMLLTDFFLDVRQVYVMTIQRSAPNFRFYVQGMNGQFKIPWFLNFEKKSHHKDQLAKFAQASIPVAKMLDFYRINNLPAYEKVVGILSNDLDLNELRALKLDQKPLSRFITDLSCEHALQTAMRR